jgi:integrase
VRWGAATEHAILSGEALPGEDLPLNDRSMEDAIDAYLDLTERMPRRSRHTILTDRDTGRRLRTAFAGHSLRSLTREDIEEYRDRRLQIVGPSSVRQDLSMLSRIYETARISWRTSIPFPGANVKLPAPPPNRKLILHSDQVGALLTECQVSKNPSLYPLVLLLLSTGMRPEEAVLLEWSRVDLERSTVYLHETKTEPRTVPIPDDVLQVLASMPRSGRMVFIPDEIAGRPKPTRYFRRSFELACVRARINQPLRRDGGKNAPASSSTPG